MLEEVEGALWTRGMIEKTRIRKEDVPDLQRIVVAIDPAVTSGENSDETGIVVAGISRDKHYYVLDDRTLRASPDNWARQAVNAYTDWKADKIVAETNNGGDMVVLVLRQVDANVPVKKVTASRGKSVRAEPVSALYEQGRVHHVGAFPKLEDQLVIWTPDSNDSPDRLDALVWALTELSGGKGMPSGIVPVSLTQNNDWSIPRL
jgi:predicted phage terminase large subunit-like protein